MNQGPLFDDDPGIMSEVETASTGFRRGGKQRSSLPVVRTPSKTLERPLGKIAQKISGDFFFANISYQQVWYFYNIDQKQRELCCQTKSLQSIRYERCLCDHFLDN